MSRHARFYRRLLRLYPATFRDDFADEMAVLFDDQLRDGRASGRPLATARLWARTLADLLLTAPGQHLRERRAVSQPVGPGTLDGGDAPLVSRRAATLIAFLPFVVWLALTVLAPGYTDPLYQNPPGILGLPAGMVGLFVGSAFAILGILTARRARSTAATAAGLLVFTIPGCLLILLAPPAVLALQGLAV